jgi:phosphoribosylamine---glycine ligase
MTMKILVIGGGGREHALVWKLRQSRSVNKVWCAPGNGGIAQDAECLAADTGDVRGLADLAEKIGADLTVVGPEQPLVLGVADEFARRRLPLVGPSRECAQLEGSKVFAKEFLRRHNIPTAAVYGIYDSARDARLVLESGSLRWPTVFKADGLCAGKGVLVTSSASEAGDFIDRVMERRELGEGGARLMVEEALGGPELSLIVLSDGRNFVPMAAARDHKRALDGDRGPNTGGMGAYSTDDIISPELRDIILSDVVRPTLDGLEADGFEYRGFLYFGLMLTPEGPKVLEFNCRLGDPEAQAIIPRIESDFAETLSATAEGELVRAPLAWKSGASLCVVMASGGYPGAFEVEKRIEGLAEAGAVAGVNVFHSGTKFKDGGYYTAGGRVLAVSALGSDLDLARERAYEAVEKIRFSGAHYRTDIARAAADAARVASR